MTGLNNLSTVYTTHHDADAFVIRNTKITTYKRLFLTSNIYLQKYKLEYKLALPFFYKSCIM